MEIETFRHKALRRYFEDGTTKGLDAQITGRLSRMFFFLLTAQTVADLLSPPNFGAHQLRGDMVGRWSMVVTRNWRMTFSLTDDLKVVDVDLEDYHGD